MAVSLKRHAYAGLWFMAVGIIPVLYIGSLLLPVDQNTMKTSEFVLWVIIFPLLVIGVSGSLIGAGILDSRKVKSGWHAAFRGLLIAVVSFLSSLVTISFWETSKNEYESFARTLVTLLVIGSIALGWLVVMAGIFAGLLLYNARRLEWIK